MDKRLFTPGPLTTSESVREAMNRDLGSRDPEFITSVERIRESLIGIAGVSKDSGYEAVIMQGSGTFGIEAVLSTVIPEDGKLLLIINGAYGERMAKIAAVHRIRALELRYEENETPRLQDVEDVLQSEPDITHVAIVHCETTTGIFNQLEDIGRLVSDRGKVFIVDAMSSFGAVPVDLEQCGMSFLVSSSNKCIEGVPGFSFAICRRSELEKSAGQARTLSLDLHAQWKGLEKDGQFRFTPPVQVLLAFEQALAELEAEGGVEGRAFRYIRNHRTLVTGMQGMGFETYLPDDLQGYIITTFLTPKDPAFDFRAFYDKLNQKGFVIYPGKLTRADSFRIGNIGRLFPEDIKELLVTIAGILDELQVVSCAGS